MSSNSTKNSTSEKRNNRMIKRESGHGMDNKKITSTPTITTKSNTNTLNGHTITTTVKSDTEGYKFEMGLETIVAIVCGTGFILLLFGIIFKKIRTCTKKKKRKIPNLKGAEEMEENLYDEIDYKNLTQPAKVRGMNLSVVDDDDGEYSKLSYTHMLDKKDPIGVMTFQVDSTGYCHVVRKSETVEPISKEETDNVYNVLENVTSGQGDADAEEEKKLYNVLENVTSDQGDADAEEEKKLYSVLENFTSGDEPVYNVLETTIISRSV